MGTEIDDHGQPVEKAFNWRRVEERSLDELIGVCKGIIADGVVVHQEAVYIANWLDANRDYAKSWPMNVLYSRIKEMLLDNVLDSDEESELVDLLLKFTGGKSIEEEMQNASTQLPLDDPAPQIVIPNQVFCFTGKFHFGSRAKCEKAVLDLQARVQGNPTMQTNYLVIGLAGSRDWIHSTHGRKIEKAVEYRSCGHGVKIVSEEHWTRFI